MICYGSFAHFGILTIATMLTVSPVVATQVSAEVRTHIVLELLPGRARSDAAVMLRDSAGERTIRPGAGFICVSDFTQPDRLSSTCHHPQLGEQMALAREFQDLRGEEFRRQVCAEAGRRGIRVPNGAMEITASLGIAGNGRPDSTMTMYHLLWVPFETQQTLGVTNQDPGDGRAWLHHGGTCQAHIMWSEKVRVNGDMTIAGTR
jgi:hypothetical protein